MAHTNREIRSKWTAGLRRLIIVTIKLIAPRILLIPARCKEKIAKSTDGPLWEILFDRGGYTVQPVPAPLSTIAEETKRVSEGGSNQNLILLRRGNAISGTANIPGTIQFPNPPTIIGITIKKIIKKAWAVTRELYSWSEPKKAPGWPNSIRIIILIAVPNKPPQIPKKKYKEPISLWLVE